jgi:hypothetical protein
VKEQWSVGVRERFVQRVLIRIRGAFGPAAFQWKPDFLLRSAWIPAFAGMTDDSQFDAKILSIGVGGYHGL